MKKTIPLSTTEKCITDTKRRFNFAGVEFCICFYINILDLIIVLRLSEFKTVHQRMDLH